MIKFTDEQQKIIDAPIDNNLVSAAAGSGKTTVLVERIIKNIINGIFGIDEVLVVTFTRDAADNMRKKIEKALKEKIKELKSAIASSNMEQCDNSTILRKRELIDKLTGEIDKLPNAYIQTLNSFCARVIKEKGYTLLEEDTGKPIDPSLVILDENTLKIIRKTASDFAIKSFYQDIENDEIDLSVKESFIDLTNMFGKGVDDNALIEIITNVYTNLRALPNYFDLLDLMIDKQNPNNNENKDIKAIDKLLDEMYFYYSTAYNCVKSMRLSLESGSLIFLKDKKKNSDRTDEFINVVNVFEKVLSKAINAYDKKLPQQERYKAFFELGDDNLYDINLPSCGTTSNRSAEVAEFFEENTPFFALTNKIIKFVYPYKKRQYSGIGKIVTEYFNIRPEYNSLYNTSYEKQKQLAVQRYEKLKVFVELLKRKEKFYTKLKREIYGMDFSDQEHLSLKILTTCPEAKEFYDNKFKEVYIDEYQDNNKLQDAIIEAVVSGENHRKVFRVGDVKQSIYKFRYASPSMFNNKMESYDKNIDGNLYLLNQNFRSDGGVIDFVNMFFEQIMCKKSGTEIDYDFKQKLVLGKAVSENILNGSVKPPVPNIVYMLNNLPYEESDDINEISESEINIEDKVKGDKVIEGKIDVNQSDKDDRYLENRDCSEENYSLRQGVLKEVMRYIDLGYKYKDIAVLSRNNKQALIFANYLKAAGIPAKVNEKRTIFEDLDIKKICNLIYCIGNIYRDEYLMGVLLSEYKFSSFSLNDVSRVICYSKINGKGGLYLIDKIRFFVKSNEGNDGESINDDTIVTRELIDRFAEFLRIFDNLRNENIMTDIAILIEQIYLATGIRATLNSKSKLEGEKLSLFKDYMCENYIRYGSNISCVASMLERMQLELSEAATLSIEDNTEDKVICMTDHKSKGLEFECVIVAGLANKGKRSGDEVLFDEDLGFAIKDFDSENVIISDSVETLAMRKDSQFKMLSEDIRLLYVAFTRAKQRLSIIDYLHETKTPDEKWLVLLRHLAEEKDVSLSFNLFNYLCREHLSLGEIIKVAIARSQNFINALENTFLPFVDNPGKECETSYSQMALKNNIFEKKFNVYTYKVDECLPEGYTPYRGDEIIEDESEIVEDVEEVYDTDDNDYKNNEDKIFFDEELETVGSVKLCASEIDNDGRLIIPRYKYEQYTTLPFKLSVSQINLDRINDRDVPVNLQIHGLDDMLSDLNSVSSATSNGTLVHSIMRYLNWNIIREDNANYELEIKRLQNNGVIMETQNNIVAEYKEGILNFANSDICSRMCVAMQNNKLYFEAPIVFAINDKEGEISVDDESHQTNDFALVQGIIDMYFLDENDEAIVVDYKTDKLRGCKTDEDKKVKALEYHKQQVDLYAGALEKSGIKVKEKYLYLVRHNMFVKV